MKKILLTILSILIVFSFAACKPAEEPGKHEENCNHVYDNNCDTDCNTCGEKRATTHSYAEATCTTPKTCSCGATEGEALGHNIGADGESCSACGFVQEKTEKIEFVITKNGKTEYFVGDALDFSEFEFSVVYGNGTSEALSLNDLTVDDTAVNIEESGTYSVSFAYGKQDAITVNVKYYVIDALELEYYTYEKLENTSYGAEVDYTHRFKECYMVGEELDTTGLTVIAVGRCGDEEIRFKVDDYDIECFEFDCWDYYTIRISFMGVEVETEVHVADISPVADEDGIYKLLVDPSYEGVSATLSGPFHVFSTIGRALDYAQYIDADEEKIIYIAPGVYTEKLEITVPNLTISGWGETADDVLIMWDAYPGQIDMNGFTHVWGSTATVSVRESAYNVVFENISISNTHHIQGNDTEIGLAILVQGENFTIKDSKVVGNQELLNDN